MISCGKEAAAYYKAREADGGKVFRMPDPEPAPTGRVAEPRCINLMDRPAYVPPKRFVRPDAMDNSLAAMPSHFGKDLA